MNTTAAVLPAASGVRAADRAALRSSPLLPRVLAFSALAAVAGQRFATLLAHPPTLRVLAVVAVAAAGSTTLARTRSLAALRGLSALLRVGVLALAAYLALRVAGVPASMAWPWHWARLAHEAGRGLDALDGQWPYQGGLPRARMAVMLALPAVIVPAGAIAFWPGAWRATARRAISLAMLLGLYLTAAVNQPHGGWQVQGILLLALLCMWGSAWRAQPIDVGRSLIWILAASLAALALASAAPGGRPLLDFRAWNPFAPAFPATDFDWNQTYGPLRWPNSGETMVEVASPSPHLWRASTLDGFNGVGFVQGPVRELDLSGGTGVVPQRWVTHATFTLRGLSSEQSLSPGQILATTFSAVNLPRLRAISPDGTMGLAGAIPQSGDRYTVAAYSPQPSASELRAAPGISPTAAGPYTTFELPLAGGRTALLSAARRGGVARIEASPYARVYRLARGLALGAPTTYAVVRRVEGFLRHGFRYSEDPPRRAYPLVSFLLSDHAGYCQQFSGAMALLLRMDGIPARVAAGFAPGSRNAVTDQYRVSAKDAHEWVEAYFAGIGWVPFDPTPARAASASQAATERALSAAVRLGRGGSRSAAANRGAPSARARGGVGDALLRSALWLAGVAAVLLAVGWRAARGRLRRAFIGDAEGAVGELSRAFDRVGLPLAGGCTLTEVERQLRRSHGPKVSRYLQVLCERRYARDGRSRLPSARDRRLLRRALRARPGLRAWARALRALPPGTPAR